MNELRGILTRLEEPGAALGHFNVAELILLKAAVAAANDIGVPVLVGASEESQISLVRANSWIS